MCVWTLSLRYTFATHRGNWRKDERMRNVDRRFAIGLALSLSVSLVLLWGCQPAGSTSKASGAVVDEIPGSATCGKCHENEAKFLDYGAHHSLACHQCHGLGTEHVQAPANQRPKMSLGDVHLCLSCHQTDAKVANPVVAKIDSFEDHLQQLEKEHRVKFDRKKSGDNCVFCHDPHLLE